jgi:phage-related protein
MSARRLILAGGTVAFAAIGVAKQRRRKPRGARSRSPLHAVTAVPLAVAYLSPHLFGFDPTAWAGKIWNFGWNVAGEIKDFIFEVVEDAISLGLDALRIVKEGIDHTVNLITGTIGIMADQITNVANAVDHVVNQTVQFVDGAFSNFRDQLKSFLEHAWDDLKDWVTQNIPNWIGDALGGLKDLLDGLAELGTDGISLLLDFVRDPTGFVWDLIKDLVTDAIDVALGGLGFGADLFEAIVRAGLAIIFAGYGDVIAVLEGAWRFLEWVATHIDDFTEAGFNAFFGIGAQAFDDRVIQVLTDRSADLESIATEWFR